MNPVDVVDITIFGTPIPQGRPKFARVGNHVTTYDPQRSRDYKQWVRLNIVERLRKLGFKKPYEKPVLLFIDFYMGIPTSWNRQKRLEAANGVIRPTTKRTGDLDNLVKIIQDAGNGLLWMDDSIITDLTVRKRYTSELARVEIRVTEVKNG